MAMSAKYRKRQQSIGAMRRAGKPIELEKLVPELSQEEFTHREIALLCRTNQQRVKQILFCGGNEANKRILSEQ